MRAALIALLLVSAPAFAAEPPKPSGTYRPLGAEEVPSPIPSDFPCIEVHWQPHAEVYREDGARIDFFDPPHSSRRIELMESARKRGVAKLVRCRVQDT